MATLGKSILIAVGGKATPSESNTLVHKPLWWMQGLTALDRMRQPCPATRGPKLWKPRTRHRVLPP
jgi:hypothetical protein